MGVILSYTRVLSWTTRIYYSYKLVDLADLDVKMDQTKVTLLCVLLCILWSLVEVQSQAEYPYITFLGTILPNHSYVDLSQVGENRWGSDSDTVQCHTDLQTCCRVDYGPHRGDWFSPGSEIRLPFYREYIYDYIYGIYSDIYEDRQDRVVHIRRRYNATGPSGIYRCVIATNTVHNDSDQSVGETVYVGLYYGSEGGT